MSYFNHSFQKVMWGAGATGYVDTAGVNSVDLQSTYGVGAFTFANQAVAGWPSVDTAPTGGEPLTLLATSLYQKDKIGPFHGGYQETTKSKMINPKFVHKFYRVDPVVPVTNIIGIGATPNLDLSTGDCCPAFNCDETYSLRVDMKGSPALRFMNRNMYEVADYYTGCCAVEGVTALVDPASVMMGWANHFDNEPFWSGSYNQRDQRFINLGVSVTCNDGATWQLYLPDNKQTGVADLYWEADGTTLTTAGTAFVASLESNVGGLAATTDTLVGGSGYTTATDLPVTGGTGTGLTVDITAAGAITVVTINKPGTGYTAADTVTVVQDGSGGDGTFNVATIADLSFTTVTPISTYVSVFDPETPNCCAGLVMEAAFTETSFLDCSFQCDDHYEIEPLRIQASMLDWDGNSCTFDQLCISDSTTPSGSGSQTVYPAIRLGAQVQGTGESILRSLILSERYQTNTFANDIRLREITQGNDVLTAVDRSVLYTCYYIEHVVPRYNNSSGVFDDDRYLLQIPVTAIDAPFEAFVAAWLAGANNPVVLETY